LMAPGARRLARALWWLGPPGERAAAVVGALWERIRTYPYERRPAKVAANLLADTRQRLLRSHRVLPGEAVGVDALAGLPAGPATGCAGEELVDLLVWAVGAGHLDARQASLIAATRLGGTEPAALARDEGLEAQSLRRRRQRAERHLALAARAEGAGDFQASRLD
ncbi:MAG: hypothetical protein ACRD0D_01560, partial [Acidimicrobiales bacterium]